MREASASTPPLRDEPGGPTQAVGRGQGKLILAGEHAVVYGHPALVVGLERGARAVARRADDGLDRMVLLEQRSGEPLFEVVDVPTPQEPMERAWRAMLDALGARGQGVRVEVSLGLPPGAGLGSSAALAAACCRALASLLGRDEATITRAVHASEGVFHGSPSGIDQAAALGGGLLRFERGDTPTLTALHAPPLHLVIGQPAPGASTARMVASVAALIQRQPALGPHLCQTVGALVEAAQTALCAGDHAALGDLLNINHGLLVSLGVSTPTLDTACHIAREAGALGAKLTGAGGGGCVFALTTAETTPHILDAWDAHGWPCFAVKTP